MLSAITKEELLGKAQTCLVEFYTPSCPYCKMLEQKLLQFQTMGRDVLIYKMNAEDEPDFCNELGIRSVPVLIRFENGKEQNRRVGNLPTREIEDMMQ